MSKPEQREVNIKTIISYPRESEVGQTYLMTVDVQAGSGSDKWDWPYAEEEYALYCILNTGQLFTQEPVGKPAIILNRFGGSYGPATFLLTASESEGKGSIQINLCNPQGMLLHTFETASINVTTGAIKDSKLVAPDFIRRRAKTEDYQEKSGQKSLFNSSSRQRDIFRPELNVRRHKLIDALKKWLQDPNPDYRLRSIVGGPGIGKTWFMTDLYRILSEDSTFHVLWLDLSPNGIHPITGESLPNVLVENGRFTWLKEVVQEYNDLYDQEFFTLPMGKPFPKSFKSFVAAISKHKHPISVLMVDGYDLLEGSDQDYIQENILSYFWAGRNTRILLSRRDEDIISHPILSWNDDTLRLPAFSEVERLEQTSLLTKYLLPGPFPTDVLSYFTSNPFSNTYLFKQSIKRAPPEIHTDDLIDCLKALMQRAGLSEKKFLDLARQIALQLPLNWTAKELADDINVDLFNEELSDLFRGGFIFQVPGTARYTLEASMYKLILLVETRAMLDRIRNQLQIGDWAKAERIHSQLLKYQPQLDHDGLIKNIQLAERLLLLATSRLEVSKIEETVRDCRLWADELVACFLAAWDHTDDTEVQEALAHARQLLPVDQVSSTWHEKLALLDQKIATWITSKQVKVQQGKVPQLIEQTRHNLRMGDIQEAKDILSVIQKYSTDAEPALERQIQRIIELLNLAELKLKSTDIEDAIENGREWPHELVACYLMAWGRNDDKEYRAALTKARRLLPVAQISPELQDSLAMVELEIVQREKETGEFKPVLNWPLPPQHRGVGVKSVSPFIAKQVPNGRDPFAHEYAEDELPDLFADETKLAFWGGHPLFNALFNVDRVTLVHSAPGNGRTAFAYGIHYYAARREVFALHIPGQPDIPEIQRRYVLHLCDFILSNPGYLRRTTAAEMDLLAHLLVTQLGKTVVLGRIQARQAALSAHRGSAAKQDHASDRAQLQLLARKIEAVPRKQDNSADWVMSGISTAVHALGFKRAFLVLEAHDPDLANAMAETVLPPAIRWQASGFFTIFFLPQAHLLKEQRGEYYRWQLTWTFAQLERVITWRYQAFAGARQTILALFESGAFKAILRQSSSGDDSLSYNPRKFIQLWHSVTTNLQDENEISQSSIDQYGLVTKSVSLPELKELTQAEQIAPSRSPIESSSKVPDRQKLNQILDQYFSTSELQRICFDFGVDYEGFSDWKPGISTQMVAHFERTRQLDYLWAAIQKLRPFLLESGQA